MLSIYVRTGVVCLCIGPSVRLSMLKRSQEVMRTQHIFIPSFVVDFFSLFFFGGNYQNVHRFDSIRVDRLLFMANGYKKYLNLNFKFKYYLFRGLFILIL